MDEDADQEARGAGWRTGCALCALFFVALIAARRLPDLKQAELRHPLVVPGAIVLLILFGAGFHAWRRWNRRNH
jgi:hypothetical protein